MTPPASPPKGQPVQQLTLAERATSRWISSANPRHPVTLAVCTAAILVADLLGATVHAGVYVVMALWVAEAWWAGAWCAAPPLFEDRLRRYALGVIGDVLFLGVAFVFFDGAQTLGVSFFALMVVAASSVLPRRWALMVGGVSFAVFAALIAYEVFAPQGLPSPVGLAPLTGNYTYLVASIAAAGVLIYLLLRTYAQVMSAMTESESRHQALIRTAADAILIFDHEGSIVEVNPAVERQTGYTWDELKSMSNSKLFHPDDWARAYDIFERTLKGESAQFEARIVLKSGEARWAEIWTSAIPVEGKSGVVAVARDVTERHRAEAQLREHDARLSLILDALNSGFYTIDKQLIVTSVRGKGSGTGSQLVGRSVVAIAPSPEEAVVQREQHKRALEGNVVTWVWPVGSGRWVRSHVAPIRNAAGEVTGAAGFWRDESAIVRAREEEDARWNRFRASGPHRSQE